MLKNLAGLQVLKKKSQGDSIFEMEWDLKWEFMNIPLAGYDCKSYRDLWHTLIQQSPAGSQQLVSVQPFALCVGGEGGQLSAQPRGGEQFGCSGAGGRGGHCLLGGFGYSWRVGCLQGFIKPG